MTNKFCIVCGTRYGEPHLKGCPRYEVTSSSPWKPIESAPLDGRPLLLGWWSEFRGKWMYEVAPAGNLDVARPGCGVCHGYATHWMDLPEGLGPEEEDENT